MYGKELLFDGQVTTLQAGDVLTYDTVNEQLSLKRNDLPLMIRDICSNKTGEDRVSLYYDDFVKFATLVPGFFQLSFTIVDDARSYKKWRILPSNSP